MGLDFNLSAMAWRLVNGGDGAIAVRRDVDTRKDAIRETQSVRVTEVHLPVAGDEGPAHEGSPAAPAGMER
jgi:hypothetical protein